MNQPLVSIIIPTYNRAHLIGETLDSVLAQTYQNWECIIVDDGSTDGTEALLATYCEKDNRFQYHHRPNIRPKGANACRNYGFELSKGEYINWFDDDDVMLEDFLKVKVDAITKGLNIVICSGFYTDEYLEDKKAIYLDEKANLFRDYLLWKLQVLTPSVLFKKSFLVGKDLFSIKIRRGQESELFSRLFYKLSTNNYKLINKPLFLYRQHSNSKTTKNLRYIKEYKESHSYIAVENLKKSIELNDFVLVNYFFSGLIDVFFRGIENKHTLNSRYILKSLITLFPKGNKTYKTGFIFFGNLFLIFSRGSYRMEKRWKSKKIK